MAHITSEEYVVRISELQRKINELTEEREELLYLDYVNNFLTVDRWAEFYGLLSEEAESILKKHQS